MKQKINQVTLCAIASRDPLPAVIALEKSLAVCEFADAILLTSSAINHPQFRCITIRPFVDMREWGSFLFYELSQYIQTEFVLSIHWDGYVLNGKAWREEFLTYDYIGARWPWHKPGQDIGNLGFTLLSKKLLQTFAYPEFKLPQERVPEDALLAVVWRPILEANYGIRFATAAVADVFSYEHVVPERPTFGFHGVHNLWRHNDDLEMLKIARLLPSSTINGNPYYLLLIEYIKLRKFNMVAGLLQILLVHFEQAHIQERFMAVFDQFTSKDIKVAEFGWRVCENSLAYYPLD